MSELAPESAASTPPNWVTPDMATKPVTLIGELGAPAAEVLRVMVQAGLKVRVLCLNDADEKVAREVTGAEIVSGTWTPETLDRALAGTTAAIFFSPVGLQGRHWRNETHVADVSAVLQAAEKNELKQFVYLSSLAVGEKSGVPCLEDALRAEKLVEGAKMVHYVFRAGPLMGPGDGLITSAITEARKGSPYMVLWGYGDTRLQPIHAHDLGRCIVRSFVKEPEELRPMTYALGGKDMVSVLDLLDSVFEKAHCFKLKFHIPIFVLKWATIFNSGKSTSQEPGFRERVGLLGMEFFDEKNDTPKLLGSMDQVKSVLQTQDELLAKTA